MIVTDSSNNFALEERILYYNNMSKMTKSHWNTDGDQMRLTMPFAKVDKARRLVSGYATLDNVDSQGDVVLAEASAKAFARARGNIREMHQPLAVGKLVDFREDEYYNADDGKFYRGIYVTAYVSKGAESTWEKVLDGTLTGFSIGGNIIDATTDFDKDAAASVRFIKEYDLVELSLVDNPANQLANVFSIQKASDGSVTMKGMVAETEIENIFWCGTDRTARTIEAETAECLTCGSEMQNIGWVENREQSTEKVRETLTKFLSREAANDEAREGGVDVSKFVKSDEAPESAETEVVAGVDEGGASEDNGVPASSKDESLGVDGVNQETGEGAPLNEPANAEEAEESEEKTEERRVVAGIDEKVNDDEVSKKLDALGDMIRKSLEDTKTETANAIATLEKKVEELDTTFSNKTSEFDSKFEELGKNLATAKSALGDVEKHLDVINSSDAIKKSAEIEKSAEPEQKKTTWGGAFSVNNLLR